GAAISPWLAPRSRIRPWGMSARHWSTCWTTSWRSFPRKTDRKFNLKTKGWIDHESGIAARCEVHWQKRGTGECFRRLCPELPDAPQAGKEANAQAMNELKNAEASREY